MDAIPSDDGRPHVAVVAHAPPLLAWRWLAHEKEEPVASTDASGFHELPEPTVDLTVKGPPPPRSASETVRGKEVIRAAPHRTAGDVLLVVPGVFITQHSGQGKAYQIFFRGFDSIHGQDLEMWVGGAPVNEVSNVHGQGYADLHFVMPEVIREVRSTPGTYDPRQGDFAVAGTLRFDLGWDEPGATAKLTYGSFGERRLFLAYHPKDAPEATFAAAEAWSTDGFGPSRAAQRASALGQHVFSLGHATSLRVLATAFASRFDSAGVLRVADLARGLDRFSTYDPHQGGASSRAQLVLDFGHDEPGAHWSLAPYLVHRSLLLRQDFTGALEDPANGDTTQQENRAWTFGATGHHQRKLSLLSEKDTLEVGFALRTDLVDQAQRRLATLDGRVTRTQVLAKIVATDVGAFVDLALRPLPRLVLRGGFRLDGLAYQTSDQGGEARSAQGAHLGKKLTVDLRAVSALHVVASYGEGFRSPQARALADGERTPFTTVRSLELGVRWSEVSVVAASASVFHTSLSDDLAFDPATARNQRVPATRRIGGAAEIVLKPKPWFVSSHSLTYTRATFTAAGDGYSVGDLLPYVPQLVARSDLSFTPELGHLGRRALFGKLGVALTSLVNRPLPYGERGEDVFLIDASAGVRLAELELGVDCFNLLGARWFDGQFVYASRFGANTGLVPERHVTVGAPRTILFTLGAHL